MTGENSFTVDFTICIFSDLLYLSKSSNVIWTPLWKDGRCLTDTCWRTNCIRISGSFLSLLLTKWQKNWILFFFFLYKIAVLQAKTFPLNVKTFLLNLNSF